jgi:hypothetical protein
MLVDVAKLFSVVPKLMAAEAAYAGLKVVGI